jgi:hypothetical protein
MSPNRITDHAQKILSAIAQRRNQWLTRAQVAQAIGKRRLTPYDVTLLDFLTDSGHIQTKQEAGFSREGYRWVYGIFDKPDTP